MKLRSPKAIVTQSNVSSGKGSFSPLQMAGGATWPWSITLSRPTTSMAPLMSVITTRPVGPARFAKASARSPLPEATSRTLWPGFTSAIWMAKCFHSRCMPSDMRSFMRS